MSPEAWQGFLDLLKPLGVYPLMAYRLRAWPEECRPSAGIMDYLNRLFLLAGDAGGNGTAGSEEGNVLLDRQTRVADD